MVGSHILSEHCHFENANGTVKLVPRPNAICFVNGRKVEQTSVLTLKTGSRVILGRNHVFRFHHPEQARELANAEMTSSTSSENPRENDESVDWDFAHEELKAKQGIDLKAEMAKNLKEMEEQFKYMRYMLEVSTDKTTLMDQMRLVAEVLAPLLKDSFSIAIVLLELS